MSAPQYPAPAPRVRSLDLDQPPTEEEIGRRAQEQTRWDQEKFLQAYEEVGGILRYALKKTGFSAKRVAEWMRHYPEFRAERKQKEEFTTDMVEAQLLKKIAEGDVRAMMFYLRTKGRKRGWSEKVDISVRADENGTPVVTQEDPNLISFDLRDLKHDFPEPAIVQILNTLAEIDDSKESGKPLYPNRDDDKRTRAPEDRRDTNRFTRPRRV